MTLRTTRQIGMAGALAALALVGATAGPAAAAPVVLPGISYEVLGSGPQDGPRATRAEAVTMRYVGRLADGGAVFSTSPGLGAEPARFEVKGVIPGISAALQLMRPGDRWRVTVPGYLAYGRLGRTWTPAEPLLKRDVPPDAVLVFEIDLVSVEPAAPTPR